MKKIILTISTFVIVVSACTSTKKTTTPPLIVSTGPKVTYATDIKAIINTHCVKCHEAGDRRGEYYNYATVKASVGVIIREINSGDMPKNASKLAQAQIDKVKQWQADGLLEQ